MQQYQCDSRVARGSFVKFIGRTGDGAIAARSICTLQTVEDLLVRRDRHEAVVFGLRPEQMGHREPP